MPHDATRRPHAKRPRWLVGESFCVRTPALPLHTIAAAPGREHDAWLRDAQDDPWFAEALRLASKGLPEVPEHVTAHAARGATDDPATLAIFRYVCRMAGRATPFGLFASVGAGDFGARTQWTPATKTWRRTRVDSGRLERWCAALSSVPQVAAVLTYRPCDACWVAGPHLRYIDAVAKSDAWHFGLAAVDDDPMLGSLLAWARDGRSWDELVAYVGAEADATPQEASEYVGELVEARLLVSDLRPPITGDDPLGVVAERAAAESAPAQLRPLAQLSDALRALDASGRPATVDDHAAIVELLPPPLRAEPCSRLFHVDRFDDADVVLPRGVARVVTEAVEVLARLEPAIPTALDEFRDAFLARYEAQTVPLLQALDEESGIGFGAPLDATVSPLLAGLPLRRPASAGIEAFCAADRHKLRRLQQASAQRDTWTLTEADLAALTPPRPLRLPDQVGVLATVLAEDAAAVDEGRYRLFVRGVEGPCGARLLGRFADADPRMRALMRAHVEAEAAADPEVAFAEIVHGPGGRTNNVVHRPVVRAFEIPCFGRSGAPADRQIHLHDLDVAVVEGRVVLWSRRLGREVRPRMSTAHNPAGGLGIYRFLVSLSKQGGSGAAWSWGPLRSAPWLPRVTVGRCTLSRQTWNLGADDLARVAGADDVARLAADERWPRWVCLVDGDNELTFDLQLPVARAALAQAIGGKPHACVVEQLADPSQLIARGPGGARQHEILFTARRSRPTVAAVRPTPRLPSPVERTFPPGSPWLYAKITASPATVDELLARIVVPLTHGPARGMPWMFVRFAEPSGSGRPAWQLRLRVHGEPSQLMGAVAPALLGALAPLQRAQLISDVGLHTYEREVERYGGPAGIELCERISCADSRTVAELLTDPLAEDDGPSRWAATWLGIDRLLADFELPLPDRIAMMEAGRDLLGPEHGLDRTLRRALGQRARDVAEARERFAGSSAGAAARAAFDLRTAAIRPLAAQLRQRAAASALTRSLPNLVMSLVHMHVNRMCRSDARAHELVLYDLLRRDYATRVARGLP